jgi:hypothetical protein
MISLDAIEELLCVDMTSSIADGCAVQLHPPGYEWTYLYNRN